MRERALRVARALTTLDRPAEGPKTDGWMGACETNQDVVVY
jgi:hypothetical protein